MINVLTSSSFTPLVSNYFLIVIIPHFHPPLNCIHRFLFPGEEEAMAIATESMEGIRTISSLTLEKNRESDFESHLSIGLRDAVNRCWLHAVAYAYSQSIFLFVTAGCFYYSAWLIDNCHMCYLQGRT